MADTFDGPSQATGFNPGPRPEAFAERSRTALPADAPPGLIKTAEVIGGTAGKIVHAGRTIYEKLDAQHRSDMSEIRSAAGEVQRKSAALSHDVSKFSGDVVKYVRSHSASEMVGDLEEIAKRYPAGALVVAALAGFLFERMLLRKSG